MELPVPLTLGAVVPGVPWAGRLVAPPLTVTCAFAHRTIIPLTSNADVNSRSVFMLRPLPIPLLLREGGERRGLFVGEVKVHRGDMGLRSAALQPAPTSPSLSPPNRRHRASPP